MNKYIYLIEYALFILSIFFLILNIYYNKNHEFLLYSIILTLILTFRIYLLVTQEVAPSPSPPRKMTPKVDACIFINNTSKYKTNFAKLIREMKKKAPTRHYLYVENARNLSNLREKLDRILKPRLDVIKNNIIVFFYGYGCKNYVLIGTEKITFQSLYNEVLKYKNENAHALILSNVFSNESNKETGRHIIHKIKVSNFLHINVVVVVKEKEEEKHLLHLISTKKLFSKTQTDFEIYGHILENMPNVSYYRKGTLFSIPSLT